MKSISIKILSLFLICCMIFSITTHRALALNPGETTHGFKLLREIKISNHTDHNILIFEHEKSGAQAIVELTNSSEKNFCIGFKTPTEGLNGVNHVIEHCILNGSKKFPVKNMVFELSNMAYSAHSGINAFTETDYTCFPIGSYDEDEFNSLAEVYSDAVFNPIFLEDERIFKKEGIRYELNNNDELVANGTVFNEMKDESDTSKAFIETFYPDTKNNFVPGGYSPAIMDLTYKEVCDTYHKYYHPSNCLFILNGKMDYKRTFEWLNKEYLSKYDRKDMSFIKYVTVEPNEIENFKILNYYSEEEFSSAAVNCFLPKTYFKNKHLWEKIQEIANDPLLEPQKFIMEKGYSIAKIALKHSRFNPSILIYLKSNNNDLMTQNALKNNIHEFISKISTTQEDLDLIAKDTEFADKINQNNSRYISPININEFMICFCRYNTPFDDAYFNVDKIILDEPEKINAQELNSLIQNELQAFKKSILVFTPSTEKRFDFNNIYKEKLLSMEKDKLLLTKGFKEQQNYASTPNTKEALKTLSDKLKKFEDLEIPTLSQPHLKSEIIGKPCYLLPASIKSTISVTLSFDTSHLSKDDRLYFTIFKLLFDTMTKQHNTIKSLQDAKFSKLSSESTCEFSVSKEGKQHEYFKFCMFSTMDNMSESFELFKESLFDISYESENDIKKKINKIVSSLDMSQQYLYLYSNVNSKLSFKGLYDLDITELALFLKKVQTSLNSKEGLDDLIQHMHKIQALILNKKALASIGIIAAQENIDTLKDKVKALCSEFPDSDISPREINITLPTAEHIAIALKGQSSSEIIQRIDMKTSIKEDIVINVLFNILNTILNREIRERGGAYSLSTSFVDQSVIFNSSSNPNIPDTLKTLSKLPDYIENLDLTQDEINKACKAFIPNHNNNFLIAYKELNSLMYDQHPFCETVNTQISNLKKITLDKLKSYATLFRETVPQSYIVIISPDFSQCPEGFQKISA